MPDPGPTDQNRCRFVLVTGPSGAGRSTAINVLEDLGFEAIDNLPLRLLPTLLDGPAEDRPMALGVDTRNRDFSTTALIDSVENLARLSHLSPEVLYLDCSRDVLLRRFSETRRRHPLAPAESPDVGIDREFDLLDPIRARASILIDTSDLNVHHLRAEVERWFAPVGPGRMAVSLHSFSYKRGLPRGIDMVFDCRFLNNPYWVPELRGFDGRDAQVADYVAADARFAQFFEKTLDFTEFLLPAYAEEGKAHFSIGFGCTGGQHRSVTVTERLAQALAEKGWQVSIRHRELERRAAEGKKQA
ncbi:Nucleotide-binding protein YvcJ (plasmid) [Pseudoseohaeicola sp. NH-UV-7]|uniref:RNase adapter RapZ n=1 Tax=unclassified Sulfitobacter TaxID=196795 RepID=UPI000E0A1AE2|nr:RNase adapter RapZ [Sulfitobacter sp. JL08]AXI53456.1 RNase adapter RapZ [Sulfitobacter sp. JL08]